MVQSVWDYLLFRARTRPHELAVLGARAPVSYGKLVTDAAGLATELLERGLTRDDMVGIVLGPTYLHLLALLALDRLSIPSAQIGAQRSPASGAVLAQHYHLSSVLSADPAPADFPGRSIRMEQPDAPTIGPPDRARLRALDQPPDALVRVAWSSGTTGGSKGALLTRACQMVRLPIQPTLLGYAPATRYLLTMGFATSHGYDRTLSVLTSGGTLVLPSPALDFATLVRTLRVTATGVNVNLLRELMTQNAAALHGLEGLQLEVTGSHLSSELLRDLCLHVTPNIVTAYGASESTTVAIGTAATCRADPAAVGFVLPSIEAEIVDDGDRPLAAGGEGRLRLRGAQVVDGYYRDEAATQRNFRAGWFYPGDLGSLGAEGLLRITGRSADAVQRGDRTVAPVPIEAAIAALPGVREAAVFPGPGSGEVCAAVVLAAGTSGAEILAAAQARLGDSAPARLLVLDALPRNDAGKVLKGELAKLVQQAGPSA